MKIARKLVSKIKGKEPFHQLDCEMDGDKASRQIERLLNKPDPCMIARFGAGELLCLTNYLGVKDPNNNIIKYILGKSQEWWWTDSTAHFMRDLSGFFPVTDESFSKFGDLMMNDIKQLDLLGCWDQHESLFENHIIGVERIHLRLLEPFWANTPWTKCLNGKKVLVVHPFAEEIVHQYERRDQLFPNGLLPEMDLKVMKTIMTYGGTTEYESWFHVLDLMKSQIDTYEYDVCLIACGAYGFPLAAHVKRQGKKAIHLGGSLQLLFGIKGKRWENPNYGAKEWGIPIGSYSNLMNDAWIRPGEVEHKSVENGCYW